MKTLMGEEVIVCAWHLWEKQARMSYKIKVLLKIPWACDLCLSCIGRTHLTPEQPKRWFLQQQRGMATMFWWIPWNWKGISTTDFIEHGISKIKSVRFHLLVDSWDFNQLLVIMPPEIGQRNQNSWYSCF